ncbi:ankyrin repeat domain-containing protein 31-like [Amblyraja radiata]|uniref:ankyrin repeat domain-containing protein 31-like n=1 Tax=Amblyraja radiata TaxID=386614 RepID=UPI001402AAFA|nr:ankyrin repeat domain-containing protein 31-like [Amblyraja radiata]
MAGRRESEAASDSDSDETIVAGSVQESEEEEEEEGDERRADRMLFIHKNAFQLYNTMNDFTSRMEAPFEGSSSPVIQLIPKTNLLRLHMENHQQQVKTPAYDEATQLAQSHTVLRFGVTCVTGVSSSDRNSSHVPRIDIERNYCQEDLEDTDETMLDNDVSNDQPVHNNEQEISDDENAPEINLLTGALITPCTPTWEGRKSFADELSVGNCTSTVQSVFSRHESLLESSNVSNAETIDTLQGSLTQVLPQKEISAHENFEQNKSLKSTSKKIPIIDLLRRLSDESTASSLTTMNLSPLMDSLDALSVGATSVESLAERKDALPVELWAALNKMPLMAPVLPVKETLASVNEKSAFNSSTQRVVKETLPPVNGKAENDSSVPDNQEQKAGLFTLHSSDKAVNDSSLQDNLEHGAGTFTLDDSDKTEIDSSFQGNLEHETSEFTMHNSDKATHGSSVQDNLECKDGPLTLHGSDKAVNDPSLQDNLEHGASTFTLDDSDKTEIDSSIQDNLHDKVGNAEADEDLTQITDYEPNSQPSGKPEHLEQKNIEFSHDKNKTEADTSKYEMMEKSTEGKTLNVSHDNLTSASHQPNVAGPTIQRKSSRKLVPTDSLWSCFEFSTSKRFQFQKRSADLKRKAVIPDHEEPSSKLLQRSEEKKGPSSQNSQLAFKNNQEHCCQHGIYNKLIDNNNSQNSKMNNAFHTYLLRSNVQSSQLFSNLQDFPKVRTTSLGQNNKERENMVETESKLKSIQHRSTSTVKAHKNSRDEKGNSLNYSEMCQDGPQRSTTKPVDEEPVMTQSVSNQSAILKCSKMNHRKNIYGETKLLKAAINGNVNLLRDLIQAGANVNLPDYAGWTALHEACYHGFHEIVSVLLTSGANVNSKGLNSVIPLQDAVHLGHLKV